MHMCRDNWIQNLAENVKIVTGKCSNWLFERLIHRVFCSLFNFTVHKAVENVTKAKCDTGILKVCQNMFGQVIMSGTAVMK